MTEQIYEERLKVLEEKTEEVNKKLIMVDEVLTNFATVINDCSINLDIIYDLIFAIVKYSKISVSKDEDDNIIDIDLLIPNINQDFLNKFAQYVFDLKNGLKDSEMVTSEEIIKMTENKIKEMLNGTRWLLRQFL